MLSDCQYLFSQASCLWFLPVPLLVPDGSGAKVRAWNCPQNSQIHIRTTKQDGPLRAMNSIISSLDSKAGRFTSEQISGPDFQRGLGASIRHVSNPLPIGLPDRHGLNGKFRLN